MKRWMVMIVLIGLGYTTQAQFQFDARTKAILDLYYAKRGISITELGGLSTNTYLYKTIPGTNLFASVSTNGHIITTMIGTTNGGGGTFTGDLTGVAFVNGREVSTNYTVTVDGGTWDGSTVVLGTGTVTIVTATNQCISGLTYSHEGSGYFTVEPEYLSATGWVNLTGAQLYDGNVSTARLVVTKINTPTLGDQPTTTTISNIIVSTWGHPTVAATTNDFRGMIIRVDKAVGAEDTVNLGQMGTAISAAVGAVNPATWANHPAISVVDLDGHALKLDANYSFSVSNDVLNFTFQNKPIFTIIGGGTATPNIMGFSIGNGTATMSVVSMRGWRPIPQWSPSLMVPSWSTMSSYASTYPELVKGRHVLTFPTSTNYPCFYRVTATNETGSGVVVSFGAPVTAPSFTGTPVLTNAIGKYDLYIDASGDLCTRRTE